MPPWSLPEQQALSGFRSRELVPGGGNSAAGRKDHRGEGFELCTDGHGVLRAKDGLLITTEARTSISSNKSFLVSAKEAVRLFAYKSGIKLVSAAADIETQALEKSIHIKTLRSQHGLQASQVFKGQMADG
jgi:type VI secretion system secreted protein VgrG